MLMLTQRRKILVSILVSVGIGSSVLFGASVALAFQPPPIMNQQFSMNNIPPNVGFSGSQFNTMIPNSAQMMGGMNQGMMGSGSVGMNPMMNMMSMMPGMFGQSSMGNMQSMPMAPSIIPLAGPSNNSGAPLESAQVISRVSAFLDELNNPDLEIGVLNENSNNFYVAIQEKGTGVYAFNLLVDKMTGAIYAEPGPNMMWNAKYGFMSLLGRTMTSNQFNMQPNSPMMDSMGTMNPSMGSAMNNMSASCTQRAS